MSTYKVPQFIEVEDTIFGPLTFKQFIYVVGGLAMCFVLWKMLPGFIAIFFIIPVGAFAAALAFYKVNNRPFVIIVESYIKYVLNGRLYLWHKDAPKPQAVLPRALRSTSPKIPTMSGSKLKELSWSLDVNENINQE
jgi:hypothetical protein